MTRTRSICSLLLLAVMAAGAVHAHGQSLGTVEAWGLNSFGQCNVPEPNAYFVDMAAGLWHSLGLRSDGVVIAWGGNEDGQCDVPAPNADFVAIAGGYGFSLGLKIDGTVVAWGSNVHGECNVPTNAGGTTATAIAAGVAHGLRLMSDSTIVAWGWNNYGQCDVPEPNASFIAVAACGYNSLGLKRDGEIVAWGANGFGQCDVPEPNEGFTAVAGSGYHSLGLRGGFPVAVGPPTSGPVPDVPPLELLSLAPNPFNPSLDILFENRTRGPVTMEIHDVGGRLVRRVPLGDLEPGAHRARWDGRDATAADVSSGVYFVSLRSSVGESQSARAVLLR